MAKLLALYGEFTRKFKKNRGSRHPPLRSICALHFCQCNRLVAGYYLYKNAGKISYEEL
jgi:hypothetical protein